MLKPKLGRDGHGKALVIGLIFSLVLVLLMSSLSMAGPMGDPEPVGSNNPSAPAGGLEDQPEDEACSSVFSDLELALYYIGVLL